MRSLTSILLGGALLAACGKRASEPEKSRPEAVTAAFPADTRAVIGVDVARVKASATAVQAVRAILQRDPETEARLEGLLARCQIDPGKDLKTVTLGMAGPDEVAVVAVAQPGRLDEQKIVACIRQAAAVETRGRVHAATGKDGQKVYFAVGGEPSLILATSEAWLGKVIDPAAPKIGAAMAGRLGKVSAGAAAWGVGELPPGVGAKLVELSQGKLGAPVAALTFEVELDGGVAAVLAAEMQSAGDADTLAELVRSQLDWAVVVAQRWGLSRLLARTQVRTESNVVRVSLKLDDKQLSELAAALDKEQKK